MQALKERILREGKNLGNGILKVDSFINHQVDPRLMDACGESLPAASAISAPPNPHRRNLRHRPGADDRHCISGCRWSMPARTSRSPCPTRSS